MATFDASIVPRLAGMSPPGRLMVREKVSMASTCVKPIGWPTAQNTSTTSSVISP